jgi:glycosyltransferase involved in cell wall biosynthesis
VKVCAISSKPCWQNGNGQWLTDGGFPIQMGGIASIFDRMELLIVNSTPRTGGLLIPAGAGVFSVRQPHGADLRRKLSIILRLPYYLGRIATRVAVADVVHIPLPGDIPALALLMAWMFRKKMIVRYCGSWARTSQTTWMNRVLKSGMRALAGPRSVMLVTGEGSKPPAPGLHWIFATALSRREIDGIPIVSQRGLSSPPQLVYLGRLSPEKGVEVLIRALTIIRDKGLCPLPQITLAGDGPQRAALESLVAELGCGRMVRFAGQLTRSEMSTLLHQSDFCVQASLTEGFSKAWLDAMAHGLPVLASNVGAAAAVIGADGTRGWLAPPGDAETLARKLQFILTDNIDWTSLRVRCRQFAETRTIENWSMRIAEICAAQWGMRMVDGKLSS